MTSPAPDAPEPAAPADPPEPEVLRADPRLRRQAPVAVVLVLGLGALGFVALSRYVASLEILAVRDAHAAVRDMVRLVTGATTLVGVGAVLAGLHALRQARRTLAAGCFPPPGSRVLRDVRLVRGPAARRKAWTSAVLAVLLIAVGVAAPYLAVKLIRRVAEQQLAQPRPYSSLGSGIGRPKPPSTEAATQVATA